MNKALAEQVMTTPVVMTAEAMPLRNLVALPPASDIGAVPVVAMAGQVLGVVSRGPPGLGDGRGGPLTAGNRAVARAAGLWSSRQPAKGPATSP